MRSKSVVATAILPSDLSCWEKGSEPQASGSKCAGSDLWTVTGEKGLVPPTRSLGLSLQKTVPPAPQYTCQGPWLSLSDEAGWLGLDFAQGTPGFQILGTPGCLELFVILWPIETRN